MKLVRFVLLVSFALLTLSMRSEAQTETVKLKYCLNQNANTTIRIYTVTSSQLVRTLISNQFQSSGPNIVTWDGRNDAGNGVASAYYDCQIDVVINNITYTRTQRFLFEK